MKTWDSGIGHTCASSCPEIALLGFGESHENSGNRLDSSRNWHRNLGCVRISNPRESAGCRPNPRHQRNDAQRPLRSVGWCPPCLGWSRSVGKKQKLAAPRRRPKAYSTTRNLYFMSVVDQAFWPAPLLPASKLSQMRSSARRRDKICTAFLPQFAPNSSQIRSRAKCEMWRKKCSVLPTVVPATSAIRAG